MTTVAMASAALLLGALGLTVAIDVVASRGVVGEVPRTSRPALPAELASWRPLPAKATEQPAGRAIVAYVDDNDERWWLMLAGADQATYRRIDFGPGPAFVLASQLSADGRFVAMTAGESARRVTIVDLVDGSQRVVPQLRLRFDDATGDEDTVLAWSPDSVRLALRLAGQLAVVDVTSGQLTRHEIGARSAAFSPDGSQLAAADAGDVVVVGGTNMTTHHVGAYGVARAGWSADGTTIALQPADGPALLPLASLHVASGKTTVASSSTAGVNAVAWRGTVAIIGATDHALETYDLATGDSSPLTTVSNVLVSFRFVQLATALVPEMVVVPRTRADRGHPRGWYVALAVVILVMGAAGFAWPRPGSARRSRRSYQNLVAVQELAFYVLGLGGLLAAIIMFPMLLLERPDLFPLLVSIAALGAATLIAALLLRPRVPPAAPVIPEQPKTGVLA